MKDFTQEEYEELIELAYENFYNSVGYNSPNQKSVMEEIKANSELLSKKIGFHSEDRNDMMNKAIALMNPYTRELVHDDLVEENGFVWQYFDGNVINKEQGIWCLDDIYDKATASLTEKQVKNSPFDISKFKKIKVSDFNFD